MPSAGSSGSLCGADAYELNLRLGALQRLGETLADCVPVVILYRRKPAIGLAHAGWGGTTARIASRTVGARGVRERAERTGRRDRTHSYEVGGEVIECARDAYDNRWAEILEFRDGRAFFDLWRANAVDLEAAGLAPTRVEIAGMSTADALAEFYSHRLEKKTGRFIAAASLRAPSDALTQRMTL